MLEQEDRVSSLQRHLQGGNTVAFEDALNLKENVGFPYSRYKYYDFDWVSESDYDEFIEFGSTASSVSGRIYNRELKTSYDITIILYNGSYYVQVEKDWEYGGGTVYDNKSFQDYLLALKYAYGVVFKD